MSSLYTKIKEDDSTLELQSDQTEGFEGHGLNITGRKQTKNKFEGI